MTAGRLIEGRLSNKPRHAGLAAALAIASSVAFEIAMKSTLFVLGVLTMFGPGCRMFAHMQQSRFFSRFVLDRTVKASGYKGIDFRNGAGGGGGIGGTTGAIGSRGTDVQSSSTSTAGFTLNELGGDPFNEDEFIEALASQIKKEIVESNADITAGGRTSSNEFYFDYHERNIRGRISISGSATGQSYLLKATVDESDRLETAKVPAVSNE